MAGGDTIGSIIIVIIAIIDLISAIVGGTVVDVVIPARKSCDGASWPLSCRVVSCDATLWNMSQGGPFAPAWIAGCCTADRSMSQRRPATCCIMAGCTADRPMRRPRKPAMQAGRKHASRPRGLAMLAGCTADRLMPWPRKPAMQAKAGHDNCAGWLAVPPTN